MNSKHKSIKFTLEAEDLNNFLPAKINSLLLRIFAKSQLLEFLLIIILFLVPGR